MKQSIAILITNFEGGGAQKIALTQAQLFQNLGYKVHIIALEQQESYTISNNLSIHFLSHNKGQDSKLKKLFQFPLLPFRLAQYLKENSISLCISHLERADFVNILAKPIAHHKTISIIHSHLTANYTKEGISFRSTIYLGLVKILERFNNRIIAVSRGIAANLIHELHLPKDKVQVILNPFDITDIRDKAQIPLQTYQDIFETNTIISIGRLSRQKGLWHSILAFHKVLQNNPKLKYIILGDGPLRDYHIQLARELGLKVYSLWDNQEFSTDYDIYFLGFQDNPFQYIAKAKALILPSHYEGLPNVLVESLIIGTPVIASDSDSGPRELLAPNTDITYKTKTLDQAEYGIIIPLDNNILTQAPYNFSPSEQYLSEAINLIINNTDLQKSYSERANTRIQDFNINAIAPQWEYLLETVLAE
jgi:glycosyltransferase involved in cell wall biosynthesis